MPAHLDASCPKCGRRFGWFGEVADRPGCPRCGHRMPADAMQAAAAEMREALRLLALHPRNARPEELRRQRVQAGLTVRQAARQLDVPPEDLERVEAGELTPAAAVLDRMGEVYACGEG